MMKTPEQLKGGNSQPSKRERNPCTGSPTNFYV